MTMVAATASQSNRVLAFCQDATLLAFTCERDTTLGQLAERLDMLAISHGGLSLPVRVKLGASQRRERERRRPRNNGRLSARLSAIEQPAGDPGTTRSRLR
jgi:hypothetical protein